MASDPEDIQEYFSRAEELRQLAQNMHNAGAKALLLRIADDYERMANSLRKGDRGSR